MSYSTKVEREILSYIIDWATDNSSPGGDAPFLFPDTLSELPTLASRSDWGAEEKWRVLHSHLMILQHRGLIGGKFVDGSGDKHLTNAGFERLSWHENQDALPKLIRFLRTSVGVLVTNIALPVLVSALTVIALSKLGLAIPPESNGLSKP